MAALQSLIALYTLLLSVASCWSIEQGAVAVAGGGDAGERVRFDQLTGPVELIAGRTLDIAFKIPEAPPVPHQIVVRVSQSGAPAGSVDREFIAKPRQKNVQSAIPYKLIPLELQNRNLDVTLYVSGGSSAPFSAKLFDLVVYGDDDDSDAEAKHPVASAGAGAALASLPEIVYTRRPDPRHVSPVIALVFVGIIDVLFGAWFLALEADVGALTAAARRLTLSQGALVASVLAVELLFVAYYISWSIFRVLAVGAVLLPVVYLTGTRAVPK